MAPANNKAILKPLLRNLRAIYSHRNERLRTLELLQWILITKIFGKLVRSNHFFVH